MISSTAGIAGHNTMPTIPLKIEYLMNNWKTIDAESDPVPALSLVQWDNNQITWTPVAKIDFYSLARTTWGKCGPPRPKPIRIRLIEPPPGDDQCQNTMWSAFVSIFTPYPSRTN